MPPPAWTRNKTKYKKYPQANGSVNVIHYSPGRPKLTIRVPKSEAHNVPAYLTRYYTTPPRPKGQKYPTPAQLAFASKLKPAQKAAIKKALIQVNAMPNGRVLVTEGVRSKLMPLKNPSKANIDLFVNSYFGAKANANAARFMLTGQPAGSKRANFFQNSTNNGRTGAALTSLNKAGGLRTVYNVSKGKKSVRLGIARLGGGEQASIYLGYTDAAAKKPLSIKVFPFDRTFPPGKQPSEIEFMIGKKLHAIAPRHVPNYMSIEKLMEFVPARNLSHLSGLMNTRHQTVIFSEYFHGGDLRTWIKKIATRVKEEDFIDIIRQVLGTLVTIQYKYPDFRHNDLHTGNVFIDDTGNRPRAAIGDFGMSRLTPTLSSPEVDRGLFLKDGIGPKTDPRYDAHMFLNSLRPAASGFPKLRTFLNVVIPEGYRGGNDTYVSHHRLKYGLSDYPGLPSTHAMLRMLVPFIKEKNLATAITLRTKKPSLKFTVSNLRRAKMSLKPVKKGVDAANIASAALANVPGVSVSKAPLSAANFIKLSPKSKQAYLATKKPVAKKPVVMQFTKIKGNATATKKTNATAYLKMLKKSPNYNLNKFFKTPLRPAKNILNSYTSGKNVSLLTTRNLRKVLENRGYNAARAKANAKTWAKGWTNKVVARRANLKLSKGPNGRVRTGARLLEGLKRDQLVNLAKKHGLTHSGKTKAQLILSLWKN